MKKVMFLMAAVSMFAFAACNQKAATEEVVDTVAIEEVVAEPVMEEVIDTTAVIEEVAAETTTEQAQ